MTLSENLPVTAVIRCFRLRLLHIPILSLSDLVPVIARIVVVGLETLLILPGPRSRRNAIKWTGWFFAVARP